MQEVVVHYGVHRLVSGNLLVAAFAVSLEPGEAEVTAAGWLKTVWLCGDGTRGDEMFPNDELCVDCSAVGWWWDGVDGITLDIDVLRLAGTKINAAVPNVNRNGNYGTSNNNQLSLTSLTTISTIVQREWLYSILMIGKIIESCQSKYLVKLYAVLPCWYYRRATTAFWNQIESSSSQSKEIVFGNKTRQPIPYLMSSRILCNNINRQVMIA